MGLLHNGFPFPFPFLVALLITGCVSAAEAERSTYIIHMDKSHMPKAFTAPHHWYSSAVDSIKTASLATSDRGLQSPARVLYTYDSAAHGFSAVLSEDELETVKKLSGFLSAYGDRQVTVDTTHTFEFLSLNPVTGLWPASDYGKDIIVGVLDTGVWPESKSYHDEGMSAVPSKWKGTCEAGQEFNSSLCNLKLIGARYFNKGVIAANPNITISMNSARDTNGHGTHTSSTAAGNYVAEASYFGYATGTARGVAPRGRLAVYKVIWEEGRYASDVLAGIDAAVSDGVDVLSISMGFGQNTPLYEDPIAIASFGAMEKGVLVSTSAGNRGYQIGRLHNGNPWVVTVAAGSVDRWFSGTLTLGSGLTIAGWSMLPARAIVKNVGLYYNETMSQCDSAETLATLNSGPKIVICENKQQVPVSNLMRSINSFSTQSVAAAIFASDWPEVDDHYFESRNFRFPGVIISSEDMKSVIEYAKLGFSSEASISFQETTVGTKRAPAVSSYTSRGPSRAYPGILKPDVMAPGTLVLASWTPVSSATSLRGMSLASDFNIISGTSMACPHVAGVAALLKGVHPTWSPAAIRSAMMTTANPLDNTLSPIRDNGYNLAVGTPISMGAGQIDPNRALDPGLVYDATPQDYANILCSVNFTASQIMTITRSNGYNCSNPSSDLNYPSFIALYNDEAGTLVHKFERTVTNVGYGGGTYKANVTAPEGTTVTVSPKTLVFGKTYDKQSYSLTIKYRSSNRNTFGSIVWVEEEGKHTVRSPIVVARRVEISS
ncbi:subtilisin-like protease SBT3 [Rhododendron vialii]|uniref:subtilisin-like protease SBT3 n=1 Tax=Rhododendron vialii TaxID=182163 RepID=UPI00265F2C26|nr:subtilisin-like protease SBT3 [Rhododendron vialii]